jgi:hypothetical protein
MAILKLGSMERQWWARQSIKTLNQLPRNLVDKSTLTKSAPMSVSQFWDYGDNHMRVFLEQVTHLDLWTSEQPLKA